MLSFHLPEAWFGMCRWKKNGQGYGPKGVSQHPWSFNFDSNCQNDFVFYIHICETEGIILGQ